MSTKLATLKSDKPLWMLTEVADEEASSKHIDQLLFIHIVMNDRFQTTHCSKTMDGVSVTLSNGFPGVLITFLEVKTYNQSCKQNQN